MARLAGDTVAAIATARGRAALAVVRVTGPQALEIADRCFVGQRLSNAPGHSAHFGYVRSSTGEDLDQVVATVFRAPASVTGEDVVELSCHGGDLVPSLILARLLECGARMAEPGEFTQRSFLNGKIDLAQAEAVADVIHASSTTAHRVSLSHLRGRYSTLLTNLRDELLELAAFVELELDFSEEDVEFADRARLERLLDQGTSLLKRLLDSARTGSLLRDGVKVVIGGRPNAGKSTLLNALVGYDRAIVSEQPGTTRDELDVEAELGGVRFVFTDTAGIRETGDFIEAEGVDRARRAIRGADVLVYVYDMTIGLQRDEVELLEEVSASRPDLPIVLLGNKRDLHRNPPATNGRFSPHLHVSARDGLHDEHELKALVDHLIEAAVGNVGSIDASSVVMNERHRSHLARALEATESARARLDNDESGDTLALDLRIALDELGAIVGAITTEDVLDQIFSRFCIGK